MKKVTVAIIALLYISIASGVVINLHYCMGNLSSVEYGFSGNDGCGKCGMKEKKGCCETEYKLIKLQDAHELAKLTVEFGQSALAVAPCIFQFTPIDKEQSHLALQYHSPPDRRVNSIYLHIGVFLI